ncbi:MAG: GNAT family N-acetyltransferase [Cyanobacteria bacterium P01_B01_bin.77]
MVIIRAAYPDDADALAQLAERTFRDTFMTENNSIEMALHCAQNFGPEIQHREIQDPNYVTLLGDLEGDLVAFAQVRLHSPKECICAKYPSELYRFYVSSEWHGRGLSHQAMAQVLAAVTRRGADYIWLGVWEYNPRAIAFYRKYGFRTVGEHIFQLGTDPQRDLIMATELSGQSSV